MTLELWSQIFHFYLQENDDNFVALEATKYKFKSQHPNQTQNYLLLVCHILKL